MSIDSSDTIRTRVHVHALMHARIIHACSSTGLDELAAYAASRRACIYVYNTTSQTAAAAAGMCTLIGEKSANAAYLEIC